MQRWRSRGLLVVSGVAGVVVAHSAADLIAMPDGVERARHLAATGHGYWPVALGLALVAGLVSMVASGAQGRSLALASGPPPLADAKFSAAGLVASQLVLFAGMETGERLGSGGAPASLLREPAFLIGLCIQVLVALLVVSILRAIERGVELLVRAMQRSSPEAHVPPPWVDRSWSASRWIGGKPSARGPPLPAFR